MRETYPDIESPTHYFPKADWRTQRLGEESRGILLLAEGGIHHAGELDVPRNCASVVVLRIPKKHKSRLHSEQAKNLNMDIDFPGSLSTHSSEVSKLSSEKEDRGQPTFAKKKDKRTPIELSDQAYDRDEAKLMEQHHGRWVAYHREKRIGVYESASEATRECRHIPESELYVSYVHFKASSHEASITEETVPTWKPFLEQYRQLQALKFRSRRETDAAIDLLWKDEFRDLPYHIADGHTLILPKEAVPYFQKAGLRFTATRVRSMDELSPQETAHVRKQGPS